MALLEGQRGHVVLERVTDGNNATATLQYADPTVRATFGLGQQQRLARLEYTSIPEPVYCEREGNDQRVRATPSPGPRPPRPADPNAPVQTNIRTGDGTEAPR
jgi:hypothetical protein